jgi:hypothetical protein
MAILVRCSLDQFALNKLNTLELYYLYENNCRIVRIEVSTAVAMKKAVFWMLCRVALVRTDVLEESSTSIIIVTRMGELETTLAVTSNGRTLRSNTNSACFGC